LERGGLGRRAFLQAWFAKEPLIKFYSTSGIPSGAKARTLQSIG
jgi:hypothetical protein